MASRRSGVRSQDHAWLFGGVFDDFSTGVNTFHQDLWRWDTTLHTWTRLAPIGGPPPARAFAAAAFHDPSRRMLVFGGAQFDATSVQTFDDLWAYSTTHNTWTRLASATPGPVGRAGPVMWMARNRVYVFGGITSAFEVLNDLWFFDLDTLAWTLVVPDGESPPPRHVAQAGAFAVRGRLTLYGGETFDETGQFVELADTWQFDIPSNRWQHVTPGPPRDIQPPRNYGAAAIDRGGLFLHGGDIPDGSAGCGAPFPQNVIDELWRFDLTGHVWRRIQPRGDPLARLKRHAAASIPGTPGTIYFFAGFDFQCDNGGGPGQIWNQHVYAYTPPR